MKTFQPGAAGLKPVSAFFTPRNFLPRQTDGLHTHTQTPSKNTNRGVLWVSPNVVGLNNNKATFNFCSLGGGGDLT